MSDDFYGSAAPDSFGIGRFRDWLTGAIGPRLRFEGQGQGWMIWGPSGAGKDTTLLTPYALQSSGQSLVVLDVKGELAAITAPHRRTLGPVYIINPYGVLVDRLPDLKSDGFNPLTALDPRAPAFAAECGYMADAVKPDEANASANSKHFDQSANAMWQAATMWEVIQADAEKRLPKISNIRSLVCLDSGYDSAAKCYYGWPVLARQMQEAGIPALSNLAAQFLTWSNEKDSIASDIRRSTKVLDDAEIAADLDTPGFEFTELKRRPCTVYIIIPPLQLDRQAGYLRLLIDTAMRAVLRSREPGEPNCVFMLNEMYALGRLDILSKVWSLVRGYGIKMISVWQDISQMESVWGKENTRTMIAGAGILSSFRAGTIETADWLSRRCGDTTVALAGYNQGNQQNNGGQGSSSGLSWGQVKVPAVRAHDLFGLGDGQTINFAAGLKDFISGYAPPYWQIRQCIDRARANPYHTPRQAA